MAGFLKCTCEHCDGHIEFPVDAVGASAPCPHCQRETTLKLDADDSGGADVVTVGGSKAKLVVGTVIASLVAVAVLGAAFVWAKRKAASKDSPGSPKGTLTVAGNATPASTASKPGSRVELDPPKPVVPVVGKFQNGLAAAQIKDGRAVIAGPCTDCHRQYDPATYGNEEWNRIVGSMRGKAKLRGRENDDLDTFVRSVRN